jgi:DNA-directed RNA polymerase subunit RPC12/RpoP
MLLEGRLRYSTYNFICYDCLLVFEAPIHIREAAGKITCAECGSKIVERQTAVSATGMTAEIETSTGIRPICRAGKPNT